VLGGGAIALVGLGIGFIGCGPATPPPSAAVADAPATPAIRIASLSPAMSRTLVDLGIGRPGTGSAIVGRTPFCDVVDPATPVIGSLLEIDYERLHAVQATHILVQPAAAGIDPELERIAAATGAMLESVRLNTVVDVVAMIERLPGVFALTPSQETRRVAALDGLRRLQSATVASDAPRVLLLVGVEPVTAAGPESYLHDLLRGAGCRNAVQRAAYPELSLEDVVTANPDAIIVLRERPLDTAAADAVLATLRATATAAARGGRVAVFADPDVLLPSSRFGDVALTFAARVRLMFENSGTTEATTP